MPSVIVTGSAEDAVHWEKHFREHGELFRAQGAKSPIRFAAADDNRVAVIFDVEDLDKFFEVFESPDTAAAMAEDGFLRETAELFIADKELHF